MQDLFERERAARRPLVMAIVVSTVGSTYRKPGASMLFARNGQRAGLLSGGCLEGDLHERAAPLLEAAARRGKGAPPPSTTARIVIAEYDSRTSDDPIWGLGLGCEGLMRIALLRLDATGGYAPLAFLRDCERRRASGAYALALHSTVPGVEAGRTWQYEDGTGDAATGATDAAVLEICRARSAGGGASITRLELGDGGIELFCSAVERAPAILLCGAGPDAEPLVEIGAKLGWQFTVVDHRPAYLEPGRFDAAGVELVRVEPEELGSALDLARFDAAVVMSHHLVADGKYLAALASSHLGYVGLLGPAARRERLFAEIGPALAGLLRARLRAPVGLDLGGRTPEAIALSIVAEIQAALNGRRGLPFSEQAAADALA